MLGRIGKLFVVTAVIFSIGLHWNFLQVVAWTGMLVRYSQDASLSEAVEKTFDGQHPCCMCKAIEQARAESAGDGQAKMVPAGKPADFKCVPERGALLHPLSFTLVSASVARIAGPPVLHTPPPTPPPIAA